MITGEQMNWRLDAQKRRLARIIRELAPADPPPYSPPLSEDSASWNYSPHQDDPPLWMHLLVLAARIVLPQHRRRR